MPAVIEEVEIKGGGWMSPEQFAAFMERADEKKRKALYRRVRDMLNPNCTRTRETFDPKHVKRISLHQVYLYVSKPTAACEAAPRIVPRKK